MDLGKRIRQARLEAGLSQRQLCGEEITRNMLSLIENGSARPSMQTLQYLAARLGKSVSYFLEEAPLTSPNLAVMADARAAYASGDAAQALKALEPYQSPDEICDNEMHLLAALCRMALAEAALSQDRIPYAHTLLQEAGCTPGIYWTAELERRRILLLAGTGQESTEALAAQLPSDDEALLLRAEAALAQDDAARCRVLLDACEVMSSARWCYLYAEAAFSLKDYALAADYYRRAEDTLPAQVYPRLEICYREMGDFRQAYEYALKQR